MDPSAPFFPLPIKKESNNVDPLENFSDIKSNPSQVFGAREHQEGPVNSWEYDEVTDVSSSEHSTAFDNRISDSSFVPPKPLNRAKTSSIRKSKRVLDKPRLGRGKIAMSLEQEKEHSEETVLAFEGDSSSGLGVGPGEPSSSTHGFSGQDLLAPSGSFSPSGGLSPRSGALDASTGSLSSLAPPPHLNPNMGMASPERRLSPILSFDKPAKMGDDFEEGDNEAPPEDDEGLDPIPSDEGILSRDEGSMPSGPLPPPLASGGHRLGGLTSQEDDEEEDDDDDDDDVQAPAPEGAYDPAEYENLDVSPEIKELFSFITRYTPQAIELEHRLSPYIPDYIPAVGDIDAFIKILPPDNSETKVGLTVLDEPSARQSDATVLDLQLRSIARHTTSKTISVKTVESAEKNPKVIEKWVRDISDLHRSKPPPTVHYSKRMPDIDSLMQEWPGELEELLNDLRLPNAALDLDLSNYAGLICAIMDIPVYKSKIQSLHVLFTLYSEFRNSVHFRRLAEDNYMDNDDGPGDRLVID